MVNLDGVQVGHSLISAPSSRALHLDPELARGRPDAYLVRREFAHLHGDGSGSLHLALPDVRAAEPSRRAGPRSTPRPAAGSRHRPS